MGINVQKIDEKIIGVEEETTFGAGVGFVYTFCRTTCDFQVMV